MKSKKAFSENSFQFRIRYRVLLIAILVVIGIPILLFWLLALSVGGISDWGPLFDDRPRLELDPVAVASSDFSMTLLGSLAPGDSNFAFSPLLIVEGLEVARTGARETSVNRLGEFLASSGRHTKAISSQIYGHYASAVLHQVPEFVPNFDVGLVVYGVERSVSQSTGEKLHLYEDIRDFLRLSEQDIRDQEATLNFWGVDSQWIERNFTVDTRIGSMMWSVSDLRGRKLNAKTELFGSYTWTDERYGDDTEVEMGLAPFNVDGVPTMCPTVCIRNGELFETIDEGPWTVIRQVLGPHNADFWIVERNESTAEVAGDFSVEELEQWLFNPLTAWKSVSHVHFPSFVVNTTIDTAMMDRVIGGNPSSGLSHVEFREVDGEKVRLSDFESNLAITVDENGVGAARPLSRAYPSLRCGKPDIEIDRPFCFFLMHFNSILVLGKVDDPTLSLEG